MDAAPPLESPPTSRSDAAAVGVRVIKKYPNRRLYDTQTSTYVTLADIKQFILQGAAVRVQDARTDENLTRSILLQIILEEEAGGGPLFSESALTHLIRCYGHAMQGQMGQWIEHNMQLMHTMQQQWLQTMPGLGAVAQPANAASAAGYGTSLKSMQDLWQQQTRTLMHIFTPHLNPTNTPNADPS